jgi:hypothetical protein
MSQEVFGAYERAVGALVSLVEMLDADDAESMDADEADLASFSLLNIVDEYTARAGDVFRALAPSGTADRASASLDRVFALASGDFRLSASLALLGGPLPLEAGDFDVGEPDQPDVRVELGDLRRDMAEIMKAVRTEPEDPDGGDRSERPRPGPPSPTAPNAFIPPLSLISRPYGLDSDLAIVLTETAEQTEALGRPVSGAAPEPVGLVGDYVDEILDKSAKEISEIAVGNVPLAGSVVVTPAIELGHWLVGELGEWYELLQARLAGVDGWVARPKRAAVKLFCEGMEKVLSLVRAEVPLHALRDARLLRFLSEVATWLSRDKLELQVKTGLHRLFRVRHLDAHVQAVFASVSDDEAGARADNVRIVAKKYREKKFPMEHAAFALRALRWSRLHHFAFPYGAAALGTATLAVGGSSVWIAYRHLGHPHIKLVPATRRNVLAEVDGALPISGPL